MLSILATPRAEEAAGKISLATLSWRLSWAPDDATLDNSPDEAKDLRAVSLDSKAAILLRTDGKTTEVLLGDSLVGARARRFARGSLSPGRPPMPRAIAFCETTKVWSSASVEGVSSCSDEEGEVDEPSVSSSGGESAPGMMLAVWLVILRVTVTPPAAERAVDGIRRRAEVSASLKRSSRKARLRAFREV